MISLEDPQKSIPQMGADTAPSRPFPYLWTIVALSACLRLWGLGAKSLWDDEVYTLYAASRPLGEMFRFMTADDPHGILYVLLPKLLGITWQSSEYELRLPFAILGIVSIPLLYLCLVEFGYRSPAARLACLLAAISPLYLQTAQEARMYPILLVLFLLTSYLLLRWLNGRLRNSYFIPAYFLSLSLGFYTDPAPVASFALFHLLCICLGSRRASPCLPLTLGIQAAAALSFVPYAISAAGSSHSDPFGPHWMDQFARVFNSPPSQTMMFLSTVFRALQAMLFWPSDYLMSVQVSLGATRSFIPWLLVLCGTAALGLFFTNGYSAITYKGRPGGFRLVLIVAICLALGGGMLSAVPARELPAMLSLLLPLLLVFTLLCVPFWAARDNSEVTRATMAVFLAPLVLYGVLFFIPMDPRHMTVPLLFLLAHLSESVLILCRRRSGRVLAGIFLGCIIIAGIRYYASDTEIFHQQDYRSAARAISLLQEQREPLIFNCGFSGNWAFRYYLEKGGEPLAGSALGPNNCDEGDSWVLQSLDQSLRKEDHAWFMTLNRLDDSYFSMLAKLRAHQIAIQPFGQELVLIKVTR